MVASNVLTSLCEFVKECALANGCLVEEGSGCGEFCSFMPIAMTRQLSLLA
jgi:hypothetical protein